MPDYEDYRQGVEHWLSTSELSPCPDINGVLVVLQAVQAREKVEAEDGTCDDAETSTGKEENVIDEAAHLQARAGKAFEILVCNAMEEVGFAPVTCTAMSSLPDPRRKNTRLG